MVATAALFSGSRRPTVAPVPIDPDPQPAAPQFPLSVPYLSQLESDGIGYDNCGPACMVMLLAYNDAVPATREALHDLADFTKAPRRWYATVYTDYPQLRAYAAGLGVATIRLDAWHSVYRSLDAGQPVIILARNEAFLPRQYPVSPAFNAAHFIVLVGYTAADFLVADPLSVTPGGIATYTQASVREGVARVGGVYALAVDRPAPH